MGSKGKEVTEMGFFKKEKTVTERIAAVDGRLKELRQRFETKGKDLEEAKKNLSAKLADLALAESEENRQALSHARKALERTQENFDEIKLQIGFLSDERKRLEAEALRATIREAPARAEQAAQHFNTLLQQALGSLAVLRDFQSELLKEQATFHAILQERQKAMATLGITESLELGVGLGELATDETPTPFRYSVQVPEVGLDRFIMELIGYGKNLLGYRTFAEKNPNHGKIWDVNQDRAGIGNVGTPGADKGFRAVWEISQYR
jgi:hypothetical protein